MGALSCLIWMSCGPIPVKNNRDIDNFTNEPASAEQTSESQGNNEGPSNQKPPGRVVHKNDNNNQRSKKKTPTLPPQDQSKAIFRDPGTAPWQLVDKENIKQECGVSLSDLEKADRNLRAPWLMIRHGQLCYESKSSDDVSMVHSVTKTLGGTVVGMIVKDTEEQNTNNALSDNDLLTKWIPNHRLPNEQVKVAHILGMVAHNRDIEPGNRKYSYDTVGRNQINLLSDILNKAIKKNSHLGMDNLDEYIGKRVFKRLGMTQSTWFKGQATKNFATMLNTTLRDMGRLGLLILNKGYWQGESLMSPEWAYKMTHPAFEDANTGYGYLTWVNAAENWVDIGRSTKKSSRDIECAPVAVRSSFPNKIGETEECGYNNFDCSQDADSGVWLSRGTGGQFILGHPGLDLVLVIKNYDKRPNDFWQEVLPAIVAEDPVFKGDIKGFCQEYESNRYAPNLTVWN